MAPSRNAALQKVGALDPAGTSFPRERLAQALRELPAPGELPSEYRKRSLGAVVLGVLAATGMTAFLGVTGRLGPGRAGVAVAVGVVLAIVLAVTSALRRMPRVLSTVGEALRGATPANAATALAQVRPVAGDALTLAGPDPLLRALAELECWDGAPDRGAAVGHAALAAIDGPRAWRWVGGITAEIVRSLALAGRVEEARQWIAWGDRHLSPVFEGESWLARALVLLREGEGGRAAVLLEAGPLDAEDLSLWTGHEARALLAYAQGVELPVDVPPASVAFIGSAWPEFAGFLARRA
jgi:hypothetical protein